MNHEFGIINVAGLELIPFYQAPYFMLENYNQNRELLGYDFFIYIPSIGTLPDMYLSNNFSDYRGGEDKKIMECLLDLCNLKKIQERLSSIDNADLSTFIEEGRKFLNHEDSIAIIGYEFIYR